MSDFLWGCLSVLGGLAAVWLLLALAFALFDTEKSDPRKHKREQGGRFYSALYAKLKERQIARSREIN